MIAPGVAVCEWCRTTRPAAKLYVPYATVLRCKDTAGCEGRQLRQFDPTIAPPEDQPVPPAAAVAPPGAACDLCRESDPPGGLYRRSVAWRCIDWVGCQQRQLIPDLAPMNEDYPEVASTSFTGLMHAALAAGGAVAPHRPSPLDPAEMADLAAQDALGRKRH